MKKNFCALGCYKYLFVSVILWSSVGCLDTESLTGTQAGSSSFVGCTSGVGLTNTSIQINFPFPDGADKVVVYRNGFEIGQSSSASVVSFTDFGLTEGVTYRYSCHAFIGFRKIEGVHYLDLAPVNSNAPTFAGVQTTTVLSPTSVRVAWNPEASSGAKASYYKIYASLGDSVNWNGSPKITLSSNGVFYTDISGLGDELPYSFGVRACTSADICDSNVILKGVTTSDAGPPTSGSITSITTANYAANIIAPWGESNGGLLERRLFMCLGAGCTFGTMPSKVFPVSPVTAPPTNLSFENIAENTNYRFKVVDVDPAGNLSSAGATIDIATGDLTAPLFGGVTGAMVVDPKDTSVVLDFFAAAREGTADSGAVYGVTDYLLYYTSAPYPQEPQNSCSVVVPQKVISASPFPPGPAVYTVNNLMPRTTYSFCMRARDAAGNVSNSNATQTLTTWDITPPVFGGVQSITYNQTTSKLQVNWNPTSSTDLKYYLVKLWKNTASPSASDITTIQVGPENTNGKGFTIDEYSIVGLDNVYAVVEACDNASGLGLGLPNNCTSSLLNTAKSVVIPDITPPQGFPGIRATIDLESNLDGQALIKWFAPNPWTSDYEGFRVYRVDPVQGALTLLKTCSCATPGACGSVDTECNLTSLNAGRIYRFHVRAYDAVGNETTYLDSAVSYADLRIKDTTPPIFNSSLTVLGSNISWQVATDNQYNGDGNSITYKVYRKITSTFASATNPDVDGELLVASSSTSFTEPVLTEAGNYYYAVCAVDSQDNKTCDGNIKSKYVADVVPPTIASFTNGNKKVEHKKWSLFWGVSDNLTDQNLIRVRIYKKTGDASVVATTSDTKIFDGYATTSQLSNLGGDTDVNQYISYLLWVSDADGNISTSTQLVYSANVVTISSANILKTLSTESRAVVFKGVGFSKAMENGYTTGSVLTIGGQECSNGAVDSDNYIYCYSPSLPVGSYDIDIVNPDGSSYRFAQQFQVLASDTLDICLNSISWGANFAAGTGTEADPYIVCNETHWNYIFTSSLYNNGVYFALGNNIKLTQTYEIYPIYGHFDGRGFALFGLSNMKLVDGNILPKSWFFYISNGTTWKNLMLLGMQYGVYNSSGQVNTYTSVHQCNFFGIIANGSLPLTVTFENVVINVRASCLYTPTAGTLYSGLMYRVGTTNINIDFINSDVRVNSDFNHYRTTSRVGGIMGNTVNTNFNVNNSKIAVTLEDYNVVDSLAGDNAFSIFGVVATELAININNSDLSLSINKATVGQVGCLKSSLISTVRNVATTNITVSKTKGYFSSGNENCLSDGSTGGWINALGAANPINFNISDSYMLGEVSMPTTRALFTAANTLDGAGASQVLNRVWSGVKWNGQMSPSVSILSPETAAGTYSSSGLFYNSDLIPLPVTVGVLGPVGQVTSVMKDSAAGNIWEAAGYDFTPSTGAWKWCSAGDYPHLQWETCP